MNIWRKRLWGNNQHKHPEVEPRLKKLVWLAGREAEREVENEVREVTERVSHCRPWLQMNWGPLGNLEQRRHVI